MSQHEVEDLYRRLIDAWNRRDADGMARLMADEGLIIGFDGTEMRGPKEAGAALARIFADHPTASYVTLVRSVRELTSAAALLHAHVGMVPPGQDDLKPEVNAAQTLVAVRGGEGWRIHLFQNTPAAYHGRPDAVEQLTSELRQRLRQSP